MTRHEIPENPEMDEHHRRYKDAVIEYLTNRTSRDERKEIVKEAISEWLDDKLLNFGRWSARGLAVTIFSALAYFFLSTWPTWHK